MIPEKFTPSGAGKTTLVEILAKKCKSAVVTGTVEVSSSDQSASLRIGFVPQQDILPPTLTVYEALLFAARLRLPEGITDANKRERVDEILEKLGISHLRNVRIGYAGHTGGSRSRGISGGEMRRVSIGLELIADPDILILDEPTSGKSAQIAPCTFSYPIDIGLDSVSASRVASVLHSIAHDPLNPIPVITSIHQPRYVKVSYPRCIVLICCQARNCTRSSTQSYFYHTDVFFTLDGDP